MTASLAETAAGLAGRPWPRRRRGSHGSGGSGHGRHERDPGQRIHAGMTNSSATDALNAQQVADHSAAWSPMAAAPFPPI